MDEVCIIVEFDVLEEAFYFILFLCFSECGWEIQAMDFDFSAVVPTCILRPNFARWVKRAWVKLAMFRGWYIRRLRFLFVYRDFCCLGSSGMLLYLGG